MSFQTFVTERLAAITATINAIATNAKKIDELPVQSNLDPASKIHVSRGGISESLEVQKIIDAVASGSYDQLLAIGEITLAGNVATIPANAQWKIDEVYYGNIADIVRTIPYCATGLARKDILVANTSNDIVLVKGPETAGITIRPNIPINTVLVTEMDVTDVAIGEPTPPIVGDNYIAKIEKTYKTLTGTGIVTVVTVLSDTYNSAILINDAVTQINTIGYGNSMYLYPNKKLIIKNAQTTDVILKHNTSGTGSYKFFFPNLQDFVLKPNEVIEFVLRFTNTNAGKFDYVGIITDLSTKVDKVTGYSLTKNDLTDALKSIYDSAVTNANSSWTWIATNGSSLLSHLTRTDNPHNVTKSQVGLGNVDNTSDLDKPISNATKAYADGLVVGLIDDRGNYNASVNTFPTTGGSGTSGAILKGDLWYVSIAGTLGGQSVNVGDSFRALVDTPDQTATNWDILESNIGYVPENTSNKSTSIVTDYLSNIKFPSAKAVYDWSTSIFQTWILGIETTAGITYTLNIANIYKRTVFTGTNPVALTVPVNSSIAIAIGTKKEFTVQGTGAVTIGGSGITFVQTNLVFGTGETFHLTKIDTDTWTVEGNAPASGAKTPYTYYVDLINGNNTTGTYQDASKPFATLDYVMSLTGLVANSKIQLMDTGTYYVNGIFNDKVIEINSDFACTISLVNNPLASAIFSNATNLKINIPKGIVDFRSTAVKNHSGYWGCKLNITCDTYKMNAGCYVRATPFNLKANTLIHEGGYLIVQGGHDVGLSTILIDTIVSSTGGTLIQSGSYFLLDFNECNVTSSSNGLMLVEYAGGGDLPIFINHGNYTATTSNAFTYIQSWQPNCTVNINYKNKCKVTGNVRFAMNSGNAIWYFKGNAEYTSTEALIYRRAFTIVFDTCVFKCKRLTEEMFGFTGWNTQFTFIDSYIEVDSDFLAFDYASPTDFQVPSGIFKGHNTVYMKVTPANFIRASSTTNNMSINVIGTLKTNGVLQTGVTQNNLIP
ncbi:hypothetical protein ACM55H_05220 [Flavobacterium sp. ZT3R17]|uniref:hypothetical protein n=1 Tax=Flavobacterium cryoconiti TaxID=3398736 RepID=UPI003A88E41F